MTYRILFVCLGNICRSPTAEGVVRAKALARSVPLELDSAGTGGWHIGKPPYAPMQVAADARGYDLSRQRARQVSRQDFGQFDLIVAMDRENLADLQQMQSVSDRAEVRLMTDFAPDTGIKDVPDPYYTRDFDGALQIIERCADGLLDALPLSR